MRDFSKAKETNSLTTKTGVSILKIFKGKRGGLYCAFRVTFEAGFPGRPPINRERYVDFRDMNRRELANCARQVGDYLTENILEQHIAEKILDLIYSELNKRFEAL